MSNEEPISNAVTDNQAPIAATTVPVTAAAYYGLTETAPGIFTRAVTTDSNLSVSSNANVTKSSVVVNDSSESKPAEEFVLDDDVVKPTIEAAKPEIKEQAQPAEPTLVSRAPQNVTIDGPISFKREDDGSLTIALPGDTSKRTIEVFDNIPNIKVSQTEQGRKWGTSIDDALGLNTFEDTFQSTLEDPKADFHQTVEVNNARFGSHEVKFKERQNTTFDGDLAVLRTISHLGLGSTWNTGLFNTGLWLTFKPPSEEDLVELYRQLTSDQIKLGRSSYGLVFANTSSFVIERICRFAIEHIYRVNAKGDEIGKGNLLNLIKAQDITSLIWGFACTMFPKGFGYNRACVADPAKCQHVLVETLNLRKLQLINRPALTERQKAHMSEHRGALKLTIKDLESYESEMVRAKSHRIEINKGEKDEICFNLRSPSIAEYIETGHRWIDQMVNAVEQALGENASFEERNKIIDLKSRATIMRQYCHWVESIEYDTNKVEDRNSIEEIMSNVSSDRVIRETFLEKVKEFIENSSVSIVGIPTYVCPVCGKDNEGPENYPHRASMIPIDVVQLFFVLLTQKQADLTNR